MGAAWAVLDAEVQHIETEFTKSGSGRCTCQARAHNDNVEVPLVGGVNQFLMGFIIGPLFSYGTFGYL